MSRTLGGGTIVGSGEPTEPTEPTRPPRASLSPAAMERINDFVLLAALTIGTVLLKVAPTKDPDTFWHIAAGRHLLATWSFDGPDPFGSGAAHPWVMHEWLPELFMAVAYNAFGYPGVTALLGVALTAMVVAVWAACRDRSGSVIALIVTLVASAAMAASSAMRPQLATFIFTAVVVRAWLRTTSDHRPRWWLIALSWVWASSHGMWFMGPVIGVVVIVGMLLDRGIDLRGAARLAIVPLASTAVAAVTPVGPDLLLAPLRVSGYTKYVTEWNAVPLTNSSLFSMVLMVAVVVIVAARRHGGPSSSWVRLGLLGLGLALALTYGRTIAVGAAIVAPLTAEALQSVLDARRGRPGPTRPSARRIGLTVAVMVTLAGLLGAVVAPSRGSGVADMPTGLADRIAALPQGTVVCNEYALGGWLILDHPNVRPAFDPRTELFTIDYIDTSIAFTRATPGWQRLPVITGCRYAIQPSNSASIGVLTTEANWQVLGSDRGYTMLAAP